MPELADSGQSWQATAQGLPPPSPTPPSWGGGVSFGGLTPSPTAPPQSSTPFFGGVGSLLRKTQHGIGDVLSTIGNIPNPVPGATNPTFGSVLGNTLQRTQELGTFIPGGNQIQQASARIPVIGPDVSQALGIAPQFALGGASALATGLGSIGAVEAPKLIGNGPGLGANGLPGVLNWGGAARQAVGAGPFKAAASILGATVGVLGANAAEGLLSARNAPAAESQPFTDITPEQSAQAQTLPTGADAQTGPYSLTPRPGEPANPNPFAAGEIAQQGGMTPELSARYADMQQSIAENRTNGIGQNGWTPELQQTYRDITGRNPSATLLRDPESMGPVATTRPASSPEIQAAEADVRRAQMQLTREQFRAGQNPQTPEVPINPAERIPTSDPSALTDAQLRVAMEQASVRAERATGGTLMEDEYQRLADEYAKRGGMLADVQRYYKPGNVIVRNNGLMKVVDATINPETKDWTVRWQPVDMDGNPTGPVVRAPLAYPELRDLHPSITPQGGSPVIAARRAELAGAAAKLNGANDPLAAAQTSYDTAVQKLDALKSSGQRTAADVTRGAGNAIIKGEQGANPSIPDTVPLYKINAAVQDAQISGVQQKANVAALRARQAAAGANSWENGPGGMEGYFKARGAMSMTADRATYTPLADSMSDAEQSATINYIRDSGQPYFTRQTAGSAFAKMLAGQPVQDSEMAAWGQVFGKEAQDHLETLMAKVQPPPLNLAVKARDVARTFLNRPITMLNNTARPMETLFDVAGPGRLAPTLALYAPDLYAKSLGDTGAAFIAKDPVALIQKSWDSVNAIPELAKRGVSTDTMFDRDIFGLAGAKYNPYTGAKEAGGGLGLFAKLPQGQRAQFLNNFYQFFRPQQVASEVLTRLETGELPDTFSLIAPGKDVPLGDVAWTNYEKSLAQAADIGRGVNLVSGHASFRIFGEESGLILNFGNWLSARAEIIARGLVGMGQGVANQIPGVTAEASFTNQMARTAMGRLAAMGTILTATLNYANGVSPKDPRALRNHVPQLVINPTGGRAPKIPGFADNTQWDLYGPVGEFIQHTVGVAAAGVKGAASTTGNAAQKAGGAIAGSAGELGYWGRGQLSWTFGTIADAFKGTDMVGKPTTLKGELPIPFAAQGLTGNDTRSIGTQIGGQLGGRMHEPTATTQLDQIARGTTYTDAQGKQQTGTGFFSLPKSAQDQILTEHPDLAQQQTQERLSRPTTPTGIGEGFKQQAQALLTTADQYLANHQDAKGQPFTGDNWRTQYHQIESNLYQQRQGVYANAGTRPGKDPVLDAYYKTIADNTDALGNPDWNAVDAYVEALPKSQRDYIDGNTGLSVSSPTVKQYRSDMKQMDDTGWFTMREDAWNALKQQYPQQLGSLPDYTTWRNGEVAAETKTLIAQGYGADVAPQMAATKVGSYATVQALDTMYRTEFRHQWVVDHPDLARKAWGWGLFTPDNAERGFLLKNEGNTPATPTQPTNQQALGALAGVP